MNIFYEEEGTFKIGAILADNDTSLQVEAPHGKRSKVKAGNVLFRFDERAVRRSWRRRRNRPRQMDLDFLWECCGAGRVLLRRAGSRLLRPRAQCAGVGGAAAAPARRAHVLLQEGQGPLPRGAGRRAEGRAGQRRAQAPAGARCRPATSSSCALRAARRSSSRACTSCCTSRTATRSRSRRSSKPPAPLRLSTAAPAGEVRSDSFLARLPSESLSVRALSARQRFSDRGRAASSRSTCRWRRSRHSASTTSPPPRSTMPSR